MSSTQSVNQKARGAVRARRERRPKGGASSRDARLRTFPPVDSWWSWTIYYRQLMRLLVMRVADRRARPDVRGPGRPQRRAFLRATRDRGSVRVGARCALLMTQPAISKHLKALERARPVKTRARRQSRPRPLEAGPPAEGTRGPRGTARIWKAASGARRGRWKSSRPGRWKGAPRRGKGAVRSRS